MRTPTARISSRSSTVARSSTYADMKSCRRVVGAASAASSPNRRMLPTPDRSSSFARAAPTTRRHDFMSAYVDDLATVLDLELIRAVGVRIGADPLGGASVDYWGAIGERYDLDLTVVNPTVDPRWAFMTLDWD